MVPFTWPQTVTSWAMTLPSTWAPVPIKRSDARNSPSILPKTCAGPLHSRLPTIEMPEPMQEPIPAFIVGSDFPRALFNAETLPHPLANQDCPRCDRDRNKCKLTDKQG